jgi:DNA-binding NarL/FixJ family response regulator
MVEGCNSREHDMLRQNACQIDRPARVLVVDDYVPWHRIVSVVLRSQPELKIVGRAFNGMEGVQQALRLQPELVLLDLGLPGLNGMEATRRIREVSRGSTILMVSQTWSADIAESALEIGASGYVVKSDAYDELIPAITTVLNGKRFVSSSLRAVTLCSIA